MFVKQQLNPNMKVFNWALMSSYLFLTRVSHKQSLNNQTDPAAEVCMVQNQLTVRKVKYEAHQPDQLISLIKLLYLD